MKRAVYILAGLAIVTILVLAGLVLTGRLAPKNAAISIDTNPRSTVYINGIRVGITPFVSNRKAGEVLVRLIPETANHPLAPFETKVTLVPGVKTVITREFGDSEDSSSGEIISFEKAAADEASLSVISVPDSAEVTIDGKSFGFAPIKTSQLAEGEHQLLVSAQGYGDRTIALRTYLGYKLTAFIKLAASNQPTASPTPVPEVKQTFIEILPTPTGFLRVRDTPGASGKEVGQVKPGQRYLLVSEDSKTGWFEIEYQPAQAGQLGKDGWISNQYGKKVEETAKASPSATPKATPPPGLRP